MPADHYSIGKCDVCGKNAALRNGACSECNKPDDFFKSFLGGFNEN